MIEQWHRGNIWFDRRGAVVRIHRMFLETEFKVQGLPENLPEVAEKIEEVLRDKGVLQPASYVRWIKWNYQTESIEMGIYGKQFPVTQEGAEYPTAEITTYADPEKPWEITV